MKGIHLNDQGTRILGIVWLCLGIALPILYLLPLFGSALLDLNGIDVISAANDLSSDKKFSLDKTSGLLMLILPQLFLFLGFLGIALGIYFLVTKKAVMLLTCSIASFVVVVAGLFCSIQMATANSGFFAMLLPKPQAPFYIALFFLTLMALAPFFLFVIFPGKKKAPPY